mmetsp:Transcript_18427/g.56300  ORF Transcript_18427/g.56300 Transcript_18427/m.56300 type:complete len:1198 (-) Transcript_18427:291-3884(-)
MMERDLRFVTKSVSVSPASGTSPRHPRPREARAAKMPPSVSPLTMSTAWSATTPEIHRAYMEAEEKIKLLEEASIRPTTLEFLRNGESAPDIDETFYEETAKSQLPHLDAVFQLLILYNAIFVVLDFKETSDTKGLRSNVLIYVMALRAIFFVQLLIARKVAILDKAHLKNHAIIVLITASLQFWFIVHTLVIGDDLYGTHIICLIIVCSFTPIRFLSKAIMCVMHVLLLTIGIVLQMLLFPEYLTYDLYLGGRMLVIVVLFVIICLIAAYKRQSLACQNHLYTQLSIRHRSVLSIKKERNSTLIHNIIPDSVLKQIQVNGEGKVIADSFSEATVLCVHLVHFAEFVEVLPLERLTGLLNTITSEFQRIYAEFGIYADHLDSQGNIMLAGGCPTREPSHVEHIVIVALAIKQLDLAGKCAHFFKDLPAEKVQVMKSKGISLAEIQGIALKMGVHTGPLVAGVVTMRISQFKVYGATITIAKELAQACVAGQVCCTTNVHGILEHNKFIHSDAKKVPMRILDKEIETYQCVFLDCGDGSLFGAGTPTGAGADDEALRNTIEAFTAARNRTELSPAGTPTNEMPSVGKPAKGNEIENVAAFLSQMVTLRKNEDPEAAEQEYKEQLHHTLTTREKPPLSTAQMLLMIFGYRWSAISCTDDEAFQEAAFLAEAYNSEIRVYIYLAMVVFLVNVITCAPYVIPHPTNIYYGQFFAGGAMVQASNMFTVFVVLPVTASYPFITKTDFFQRNHQVINITLNVIWIIGRLASDAAYNAYPQYGLVALLIVLIYQYKLIFFYIRVIIATIVAVCYYLVVNFIQVYKFNPSYAQVKLASGTPVRKLYDDEIGVHLSGDNESNWINQYLLGDECQAADFTMMLMQETFQFMEDHVMITAFNAASHFFMLIFFAWSLAVPTYLDERIDRIAFNTKLMLDLQKQEAEAADVKYMELLERHFPTSGLPSSRGASTKIVDPSSDVWQQFIEDITFLSINLKKFDLLVQAQDPEGLMMKLHFLNGDVTQLLNETGIFFLENVEGTSLACDLAPTPRKGGIETQRLSMTRMLSMAFLLIENMDDQDFEGCIIVSTGDVHTWVLKPESPRYHVYGQPVRDCWNMTKKIKSIMNEGATCDYAVVCTEAAKAKYEAELAETNNNNRGLPDYDARAAAAVMHFEEIDDAELAEAGTKYFEVQMDASRERDEEKEIHFT